MNHKPLFFGICVFYALAAIVLNLAGSSPEPAPWQMMAAPVQTPGVAGWVVLSGILLTALFLLLRLAWNARDVLFRTRRHVFAVMLVLSAVLVKFAATKRLSFVLVNKRSGKDARVVLNLSKSIPEQTITPWEYSSADRFAIGQLPAKKLGGKTLEIDLPAMSVVRFDVKE